MRELEMQNGRVADARDPNPFDGMALDCSACETRREAFQKAGDPENVCRCTECGKKHSTDALEVA